MNVRRDAPLIVAAVAVILLVSFVVSQSQPKGPVRTGGDEAGPDLTARIFSVYPLPKPTHGTSGELIFNLNENSTNSGGACAIDGGRVEIKGANASYKLVNNNVNTKNFKVQAIFFSNGPAGTASPLAYLAEKRYTGVHQSNVLVVFSPQNPSPNLTGTAQVDPTTATAKGGMLIEECDY